MLTDILYEDKDLLVCYKPAGLAVQTASLTQADLVSELKNYRKSRGEACYIGLISRLDQPVEGLVPVAKTPLAAGRLEGDQGLGQIEKYYLAVTRGLPEGPACRRKGTKLSRLTDGRRILLEEYMLPPSRGQVARLTREGSKGARRARLWYEVLDVKKDERGRQLALVKIRLLTGRRHQIRLQLSGLGSPILGDSKYGAEGNGQPLALCAYRLALRHPEGGERLTWQIKPRGAAFGSFAGAIEAEGNGE